jgi:hypothetical protein
MLNATDTFGGQGTSEALPILGAYGLPREDFLASSPLGASLLGDHIVPPPLANQASTVHSPIARKVLAIIS